MPLFGAFRKVCGAYKQVMGNYKTQLGVTNYRHF
jgi:hypothetical protein